MLEKPDIQDTAIIDCLWDGYGINAARLDFLPLGADSDTAVYRATDADGQDYFVKLRRDPFNEITVLIPRLLFDHGMTQVIPPLATQSGQVWVKLNEFNLILFPYIEGEDGFEHGLSDSHWGELGRALKALHSLELSQDIRSRIQREDFTDQWREQTKDFMRQIDSETFADPVAAELADFLRSKRDVVEKLVTGAETYAQRMREESRDIVLCHADIHGWNLLIDQRDQLYIVDWDTLLLAPKEHDLMFIGSGLFPTTHSPQADAELFYQGYGETQVDPIGLAYYRYERVVRDIAAYCEEILLTEGDSLDRRNGLKQLTGQFEPGQVIDIAFRCALR